MQFAPAFTGFAISLSLILAIGSQNAFVLRQGIKGQFIFWVCLVCALSDAILITLGVSGFAVIVESYPFFPKLMRYFGAAFLLTYGFIRFKSAWKGGEHLEDGITASSFKTVILTCLAFTWLNPHVYLDTFALIGSVSLGFKGISKLWFTIGAITASFVFFFSLGFGATKLRPLLQTERSWQILDTLIGLTMWAIAAQLLLGH